MAEHDVRVAIKRIYEKPEPSDGTRVLVDRLWARGISKEAAGIAAWMKELGPSSELRIWFDHQPDRWDGFVEQYRRELLAPLRQILLAELQGIAGAATITLVYGARDTKENEAVVLRDYLLHESDHPDGFDGPDNTWDAAATLLLTVAVVAAAHHDAVAPASELKLFASALLTAHELDDTTKELVTRGDLRATPEGWQLTPHGQQQAQHLSREAPTSA
ncbi:MAG: DUF488 family protein [Ktedonobacterales bacterium]